MISKRHRDIATNVASGTFASMPYERGHQKAYTYGLILKAISQVALPTVDEVLRRGRPKSVLTVTDNMASALTSRCKARLREDRDLKCELADAIATRGAMVGFRPIKPRDYLSGGVRTAMHAERKTLTTIQRNILDGQHITEQGLIRSQRVPFSFAMQGLAELDLNQEDLVTSVPIPRAGYFGRTKECGVFRPEIVSMTPDQGLSLIADNLSGEGVTGFAGEPSIGCPVTMIKYFIRDMHTVTALACAEAGIIPISKS